MIGLTEEIESLFASLVVWVPQSEGTRYFYRSTWLRPTPCSAVERVRNWRMKNRERRNQTARAKNAVERAQRAEYARLWRANRKSKDEGLSDRAERS